MITLSNYINLHHDTIKKTINLMHFDDDWSEVSDPSLMLDINTWTDENGYHRATIYRVINQDVDGEMQRCTVTRDPVDISYLID